MDNPFDQSISGQREQRFYPRLQHHPAQSRTDGPLAADDPSVARTPSLSEYQRDGAATYGTGYTVGPPLAHSFNAQLTPHEVDWRSSSGTRPVFIQPPPDDPSSQLANYMQDPLLGPATYWGPHQSDDVPVWDDTMTVHNVHPGLPPPHFACDPWTGRRIQDFTAPSEYLNDTDGNNDRTPSALVSHCTQPPPHLQLTQTEMTTDSASAHGGDLIDTVQTPDQTQEALNSLTQLACDAEFCATLAGQQSLSGPDDWRNMRDITPGQAAVHLRADPALDNIDDTADGVEFPEANGWKNLAFQSWDASRQVRPSAAPNPAGRASNHPPAGLTTATNRVDYSIPQSVAASDDARSYDSKPKTKPNTGPKLMYCLYPISVDSESSETGLVRVYIKGVAARAYAGDVERVAPLILQSIKSHMEESRKRFRLPDSYCRTPLESSPYALPGVYSSCISWSPDKTTRESISRDVQRVAPRFTAVENLTPAQWSNRLRDANGNTERHFVPWTFFWQEASRLQKDSEESYPYPVLKKGKLYRDALAAAKEIDPLASDKWRW